MRRDASHRTDTKKRIFPHGQRLKVAQWPDVIFRVVDTGIVAGDHWDKPNAVVVMDRIGSSSNNTA